MKRLLTLLTALGLLLAACGDDDDGAGAAAEDGAAEVEADDETEATDGDEAPDDGGVVTANDYSAAVAADLQQGDSFPGSDEQIGCLADGFVEALGGAEELETAGITPEELASSSSPQDLGLDIDTDQVADDLVAAFQDCDYDLVDLLVESFGGQAPDGFEDCVREEISEEELTEVMARALADPEDPDAADEILAKLEACAGPADSAPTTSEG